MKFITIVFFFISTSLFAKDLFTKNQCPQVATVTLQCEPSQRNFQLVSHSGVYVHPNLSYDKKENLYVCTYSNSTWSSTYKYTDAGIEKVIQVTSLEGLSNIVHLIDKIGFKVDHFGENSNPFLILTFKPGLFHFSLDQIFLFSGLESTFDGTNNFSVDALDEKKFSTIVIDEKYLKTGDTAADTFVTGSNCSVRVE